MTTNEDLPPVSEASRVDTLEELVLIIAPAVRTLLEIQLSETSLTEEDSQTQFVMLGTLDAIDRLVEVVRSNHA